jgi:cytochrome c1
MRILRVAGAGASVVLAFAFSIACSKSASPAPAPAAAADAGSDAGSSPGALLVAAKNCQSCHGQDLSGDADGLAVFGYPESFPKNLTPDDETGLGTWTVDDLKGAVNEGHDDEGAPFCPPMPLFGFTDQEVADLYAYLRSLAPVKHDVPESVCVLDAGSDASDQ